MTVSMAEIPSSAPTSVRLRYAFLSLAAVGSLEKFRSNLYAHSLSPSLIQAQQGQQEHEEHEEIYDVVLIGRTLESLFVLERLPPSVERVLVIDDGCEERIRARLPGATSSSSSSSSLALVSAALPTSQGTLSSSSGRLMRLPHTIHPASKPLALKYFAEKKKRLAELVTVGADAGSSGVQRAASAPAGTTLPTASLFVDFCDSLIAGLTSHAYDAYDVRVVQGRVANVEETRDGGEDGGLVKVEVMRSSRGGEAGEVAGSPSHPVCSVARDVYRGRAMVVSSSSLGYGVAPVVPSWWQAYTEATRVQEADGGESTRVSPPGEAACQGSAHHVVVVGGGMTGATRALEILESSSDDSTSVTLITRRALLQQAFDVDPGWWGTKYMNSYEALTSASKRLEACRVARPRGSVRGDVYRRLMESGAWGARLRVLQGVDVQTCERIEEIGEIGAGAAKLLLRVVRHPGLSKAEAAKVVAAAQGTSDGLHDVEEDLVCDAVEIACGSAFDVATHPVLGPMVARGNNDDRVQVLGGYPVVQKDCRLYEGSHVFVAGRGAMIAVGPCGGNMVGMRTSAERICGAVAGIIDGDRHGKLGNDGSVPPESVSCTQFDPVKRVTTWTSVDGVVLGDDDNGTSPEFPLESSNALSLLPKTPPSKTEDPLDPASLPCRNVQHLESYAFSDEGFRLSIIMSFPEPISKDRVRIRVTRTSLEVWLLGHDTAYHVHVARLYGNVLPERTAVLVREERRRVTIKLHKEKDVEWKFLKGQ